VGGTPSRYEGTQLDSISIGWSLTNRSAKGKKIQLREAGALARVIRKTKKKEPRKFSKRSIRKTAAGGKGTLKLEGTTSC